MKTTIDVPEKKFSVQELNNNLYDAFKFFNMELFNNLLPPCGVTIAVKKGAAGVYQPGKFISKANSGDNVEKMDDIMLNPIDFDRDEKHVLSVLVHEMVHQWEWHIHDNRPKGGYHDVRWAESMKSIGLFPSNTGEPGGKETGRKMSHFIVSGGLFDVACDKYLEMSGFNIEWFTFEKPVIKKTSRKRTYRCECSKPWYSNVSGRSAICNDCGVELVEDDIDG